MKQIFPFSLSKESSCCIKGILCIGILLHHLAQRTQLAFLRPFGSIGFYFVAGFFFLTGYGLSAQFAERGQQYLKGFSRRQLCKIGLPYAAATCLYALCCALSGRSISLLEILSSQLFGDPFLPFSWYALSALLLLPTFGFCLRIAKKRASALLLFGLFLLGYALFCIRLGYGPWWYLSCPALLLGAFCHGRPRSTLLLFSLGAWLLCLFFREPFLSLPTLHKMFSILSATAVFFLFFAVFPLRSKPLHWLGERSLYFYLLQGIPMNFLRSDAFYPGDLAYALLCALAALGLAELAYRAASLCRHPYASFTGRNDKLPEPPLQSLK